MQEKNNSRLLKTREAAKFLAISERSLFNLYKSGQLPFVRVGRAVRFDLNDLEQFIQGMKSNQTAAVA